ncbi:uncharacterized protein LOC133649189 [Entelurus aequoreus]|uniref:uncharacterized protein LOC133649189 n=1 Tax=Entelurus aequoreus TaxID=161455 RepID=UPI002B1DB4E1|nr:uncharacterized protein LOC133649189 [Entelurus aequoreus]
MAAVVVTPRCRNRESKDQCVREPKYGPSPPESPTQSSRRHAQGTRDYQPHAVRPASTARSQTDAPGKGQGTGEAGNSHPAKDHTPQGQKGRTPRPEGPRDSPQPDAKTAPPLQQLGPHKPNPFQESTAGSSHTPKSAAAEPPSTGPQEPPTSAGTPTMVDGTSSNCPGGSSPWKKKKKRSQKHC